MLSFLLIFVISQQDEQELNNEYAQKGLALMIQASAILPQKDLYYKNNQAILNMRHRAINIANKIYNNKFEIRKLMQTNNVADKVAAAYAFATGTDTKIDEGLFRLLVDENNLVSIAARESFVFIVQTKLNNFIVDQGPSPLASQNDKHEAAGMWRGYLAYFNFTRHNYTNEESLALKKLKAQLEKESANNITRTYVLKQLEPEVNAGDKSENDDNSPLPSDFIDPSAYTVKADVRKKLMAIGKR